MSPLHFTFALTLLGQSSLRGSRLLLSLYALDLGAGALMVGILLAVFSLMPAIVSWHAGRWTDRAGCRAPLLYSSLLSIVGFAIPFLWRSLPALFVAAVIVGIAYGTYHVAQMNAVGVMSTPETRARNLSNLSLMFSVTNFAGPLLAGFSLQFAGNQGACLWFAALAAATSVAILSGSRLLPGGQGAAAGQSGKVTDILRDPKLRKIMIIGGIVFAAIDVFQFYVPIRAHDLGISPAGVGTIMACFPAAAFVSRIFLPWFIERSSVESVLMRAFVLATLSFVLMPFVESPYGLALLVVVYGFGLNLGQPITLILAYDNAAAGRSGEVIGLRESLNQVTRVMAPIVFGAIGSLAGVTAVFVGGGAMLLGGALALRRGKL